MIGAARGTFEGEHSVRQLAGETCGCGVIDWELATVADMMLRG